MELRRWRTGRGLTLAQMAELLGLSSAASVHDLESGRRKPSLDLMSVIQRETAGLVRIEDFVDPPEKTRAQEEVA